MKFVAYEQKAPLLLLLFVLLIYYGMSLWILLLSPLLLLSYELSVQQDEIRYTIKVLAIRLWTRVAKPDMISQMEFKRAGWTTKCIVIHVRSGMNWRLLRFRPQNIDRVLEEFATQHEITLNRHPDYQSL